MNNCINDFNVLVIINTLMWVKERMKGFYLEFLLFEPGANLLQLVSQVGQGCRDQLLLVLVPRTLTDHRSVAGHALHLIRNVPDFQLQFLVKEIQIKIQIFGSLYS